MGFNHELCETCGGPLKPGPMGPQCMLCLFSLGVADEVFADVAEFFPELSIREKIARGGFGTVFRAEHRRMKRSVALKFLDMAHSPEAVALFEKEMVTVGGLDHPGIVRAHDAGEREGRWYIVMELVDGADCGALVRKHGTLPIAESCEIIRQAALALHYAHGKGLVHRDVKPGNIMIARAVSQLTVKVLDFGLASIAVAPLLNNPAALEDDSTGDRFLGTLEYVAPEQIEAPAKVDARADIYALGATLRRFLTGKPAREGHSEQSLLLRMKAITSTPVGSISALRPDLPPALAQLCDQLVALDRNQRPPTAAEVAELLHPWCAGAELSRLFTDGPLPEKPFVFPKKNRRPLWLASAVLVAMGTFLAWPTAPTAPLPYRPLFPAAYFAAQKISPDDGPRLFSKAWEPELVSFGTAMKQYGRLTPDGAVLSVDSRQDDSIRHWDGRNIRSAFQLPAKRPEIYALGVAPDGHVVWATPQDKTGLHIGRAKPDGTLLPTLRYNFGAEFGLGLYELGRQALIKMNYPVADGEPRGFAFVTAENLPANTGLRPGDVIVADYGQREFSAGIQQTTGLSVGKIWSIPGLWRFRLDDDAPARRLAKASPAVMPLDIAISKHGVFILDRAFHNPDGESDDPRHLTDHVWRWDLTGWHSCTTDLPLLTPCGIAADPLSADLYVLCGEESLTTSSDRQSLLRLTPAGPDRYTVTPVVTRLGKADRGGIAFSTDGKRMILTDSGNRVIVVLKRHGTEPATVVREADIAIPGWKVASNLSHTSPYTSPQFLPGSLALYCSRFRLRIVEKEGAGARDFIAENSAEHPTFAGVSPLTGHIAWTQTKDSLQPGIGRATTDGTPLAPLKFADPAPPVPGSFAFVTEATPGLRPGDVLLTGSRHPAHAESTSGLWRFRFDDDEPAARLLAVGDATVNALTISKTGVFLLASSGLHRWDGTALHPITISQPLQGPIALAADPLSSDLFLLEPKRLLRLRPSGTDTYTVEILTTAIVEGVAAGLCFSGDGKRLLLGDHGSKKTWVLERKDE